MQGETGRKEEKFYTHQPLSMAVKFPAYLTYGDTIAMPLVIKNNTGKPISGILEYTVPSSLELLSDVPLNIEIESNKVLNLNITFFTKSISGKDKLTVSLKAGAYHDAFIQEVDVRPKGFPTFVSVSGKELEKHFNFTISKPVLGSIKAQFSAYP
ncbi:MAG: hypothetical protein HC830_07670, partial [Bacteroidetes bacterium]|nr:hypothetical protein [Bacteroidota bacterium]